MGAIERETGVKGLLLAGYSAGPRKTLTAQFTPLEGEHKGKQTGFPGGPFARYKQASGQARPLEEILDMLEIRDLREMLKPEGK